MGHGRSHQVLLCTVSTPCVIRTLGSRTSFIRPHGSHVPWCGWDWLAASLWFVRLAVVAGVSAHSQCTELHLLGCRSAVCSTYRKRGVGLPLGVGNQWLEAHCGVEAGLSRDFSHVLFPSALQEGCLWPSESSVSRQGASEVQWHFLPSLA